MRILIFGDVHGNLIALEKMLAQVQETVDRLICHGDVVNYGPWSNECVQLLEDLQCTCLQGNHEAYFLTGSYPGQNKIAQEFFNYCYPQFEKQQTIAGYGDRLQVGDFQVQHTVQNKYIFPDSDFNSLDLEDNYIIGHSHHQFSAETNRGKKLINTGSVGQNRKFINVINYVIYDTATGHVNLEALVYEVRPLINEMKHRGYPAICLEYYNQKKQL